MTTQPELFERFRDPLAAAKLPNRAAAHNNTRLSRQRRRKSRTSQGRTGRGRMKPANTCPPGLTGGGEEGRPMGNQYVIIRDHSAGNETVGEMWQETKVLDGSATLDDVMAWAMVSEEARDDCNSRQRITITKPHV